MCGIAGIFDLRGQRDIDRAALRRMTDALAHRGPDGEGFFYEPGIGLGHRRLAIIDREGGQQPFRASTKHQVLSFNGEIYNYQDLGQKLQQAGTQLKTRSDTEILSALWAAKGPDALQELVGMFAFGLWDEASASLTLARDRLGERPLYYAVSKEQFLVFASELPALLASGLIAPTICPEALADYFAYGYVPDPKVIYHGVHKLPAGHFLTLRQGRQSQMVPVPYWQLHMQADHNKSYDDACEELAQLLNQAVGSQMVSDVPLGAFLSGGIDSGLVVAHMAEHSTKSVQTCTIGFNEASHDERALAQLVAERYGTKHTEQIASLSAHTLIDKIAGIYGEPFADSSALPTWLVCKMARQHVRVALTGDGGDEVFAGYRRYPFFVREERMKNLLPAALRQPLFGALGQIWPKLDNAPRPLRLKTTFQALSESRPAGYFRAISAILPDRLARMLSQQAIRTLGDYTPASQIAHLFDKADTDDPLLAAQYVDLKSWLPGRMLVKTDRAAMANGLELRPPLLDHRLVEWAASLPAHFKLQGQQGKRLLKEHASSALPRQITHAPKRGFGLPITHWLRTKQNNPLDRLEHSTAWHEHGFLDKRTIEKMITAHKTSQSDFSQELWSVIMYDAFLASTKSI